MISELHKNGLIAKKEQDYMEGLEDLEGFFTQEASICSPCGNFGRIPEGPE
jgi:hypothetical protein